MKKNYASVYKHKCAAQHIGFAFMFILSLLTYSQLQSQTVVWSDNFDAPSGGANNNNAGAGWTLNSGGNGTNQWFINTGASMGCGSSANSLKISCSGFLCGFLGGPNEPIYLAAASNDRTAVSPNINTTGLSNLTLSFVFQCLGFVNQDYGTVSLSSDGGTTWTDLAGRFESVSNCSTYTAPIPAQYQNINNFRIRFRWIESNASQGADPAFNIDNIQITTPGQTCTPPTVSAGSNVSICPGQAVTIGGNPTASGGSEAGAFVYSWSPATGLSASNVANPSANPSSTTTYTVSVHRGTPACSATSQVTVTVNTPAALSITPAGSTNICPGQSVSLSGTAGFTNYTWTLPGGGTANGQTINATQIGSYNLTATGANGCQSSASPVSLTAGNAANIAVTANGPLTFCQGQSVTLTAAAGFTNYVWSNGTQGSVLVATQAGTYSVTAEGGACGGVSDDVVVSVSPAQTLSVTPSGSVVLCQGETVTLVAQAGFTNYLWSTNESGNELEVGLAGLYSVSATDANGCTAVSSNVNVSINPVFSVGVTPSGNVSICEGESITLTAQSGFSDYVWSNSSEGPVLTVNSPGFYSVSATNAQGCQGSSQIVNVSIINVGNIGFTWTQTDVPIYTVQFTSSVDANSYLWDFGDIAGTTSTEANPSFTYPNDAVYDVTLTVETDCGDFTVNQEIDVIKTSIESIAGLNSLNIRPSADGTGVIINASHSSANLIQVQLIDLSGRVLITDTYVAGKNVTKYLNLGDLSSGLYFVCLSDGQNYVARKWVR